MGLPGTFIIAVFLFFYIHVAINMLMSVWLYMVLGLVSLRYQCELQQGFTNK